MKMKRIAAIYGILYLIQLFVLVLFSSRNGLNESIVDAISHGDLIVDIQKENNIVGKLIVYNDQQEILQQQK